MATKLQPMTLVTIAIGTGYDADGMAIPDSMADLALEKAERDIAELAGGFTRRDTIGGYLHADGRMVRERSVEYAVVTQYVHGMERIARDLKRSLNQESVLFTVAPMKGRFL